MVLYECMRKVGLLVPHQIAVTFSANNVRKKGTSRLTFAQWTVLAHFDIFTARIVGNVTEDWALT